jgi:hypothetical protein
MFPLRPNPTSLLPAARCPLPLSTAHCPLPNARALLLVCHGSAVPFIVRHARRCLLLFRMPLGLSCRVRPLPTNCPAPPGGLAVARRIHEVLLPAFVLMLPGLLPALCLRCDHSLLFSLGGANPEQRHGSRSWESGLPTGASHRLACMSNDDEVDRCPHGPVANQRRLIENTMNCTPSGSGSMRQPMLEEVGLGRLDVGRPR